MMSKVFRNVSLFRCTSFLRLVSLLGDLLRIRSDARDCNVFATLSKRFPLSPSQSVLVSLYDG